MEFEKSICLIGNVIEHLTFLTSCIYYLIFFPFLFAFGDTDLYYQLAMNPRTQATLPKLILKYLATVTTENFIWLQVWIIYK